MMSGLVMILILTVTGSSKRIWERQIVLVLVSIHFLLLPGIHLFLLSGLILLPTLLLLT